MRHESLLTRPIEDWTGGSCPVSRVRQPYRGPPLVRTDLDDFVACYKPGDRGAREESERFRRFTYDELVSREKASLDIFWLRDDSLEDVENLPAPSVIAAEIVQDLEAALGEFAELAEALQGVGIQDGTDNR